MLAAQVYPDEVRSDIANFVPPQVQRLLDVGCAGGAFGEPFVRNGADVWGIELNPDAAAQAATRLTKVLVGQFPGDFASDKAFDCITFNDVLEHMSDPEVALLEAKRYLAANGCVIASIPNIRHISVLTRLGVMGRWTYSDLGILDRTHLRFYTRSSMRQLFEDAGYEVLTQAPVNISFLAGRSAVFRGLGKLACVLACRQRTLTEFFAVQYVIVARPR